MLEFRPLPLYEFSCLPDVGQDNWEYAFAAAQIKALEDELISRNTFTDMINAADFNSAAECLSGTDYAFAAAAANMAEVEAGLIETRSRVRKLFCDLIDDRNYIELLWARTDFSNLRLAIRRLMTEKPIGLDYSDEGCVPADKFEEVLEQENYIEFPLFLQEAVERAVLKYYENKDVRQIDYGVDQASFEYFVEKAEQIDDVFCLELFRMMADLNDIRTLLRLKFRGSDQRDFFLGGGYLDKARLVHCLDAGYETIPAMFACTPYYSIVEAGVNYLVKNDSFLRLEQMCSNRLMAYLKSTDRITAGPQPVIAYLLRKEMEIRAVRMVLVGKKNSLEPGMLDDGLYHIED